MTPALLLPRYGGTCAACGVDVGAPPRPGQEAGALFGLEDAPRLLCFGCGLPSAPAPVVPAAVREPLYPYQREGVAWLLRHHVGLLADQQGLGKTIQVLTALRVLGVSAVVVCPANAVAVWQREAARWAPDHVARSARSKPRTQTLLRALAAAAEGSDRPQLVLTNPERLLDAPAGTLPRGAVVVHDEAHYAQNPSAQRTRRWTALATEALRVGGRAWLLTGTPLRGHPDQLWGVLRAGGVLHRAAFAARRNFDALMVHRDPASGALPATIGAVVDERLGRVMLRRLRRDVLPDLPTKRWEERTCEVDAATLAAVAESMAELAGRRAARTAIAAGRLADPRERGLAEAERERRRAAVERFAVEAQPDPDAVDLAALTQAVLEEDDPTDLAVLSRVRAALSLAKLSAAEDLAAEAEANEEPLLVFSAHRAVVEALGARERWATIAGGVSAQRRGELQDRFQAGELKGLALTIGAGATALTLTAAAWVVFVDLSWTPADNEQAEDRACRIGQTRGVLVSRLVAEHPVDAMVHAVLGRKRELIDAVGLGV